MVSSVTLFQLFIPFVVIRITSSTCCLSLPCMPFTPPQICPPPAPPCLQPIPCPPIVCPPPVICPPALPPFPPLPQICLPPPLPTPCIQPAIPYYPPSPPVQDCCCLCANPCRYERKKLHGARIFSAQTFDVDPVCSNSKLKLMMKEHMVDDPAATKRALQKAAEAMFGGKFNVICAKGDFSYLTYTETFCQSSNDDVTCYMFKSSS